MRKIVAAVLGLLLGLALGAEAQVYDETGAQAFFPSERAATATLNALNAAATVRVQGRAGVGMTIVSTTLNATVTPEITYDGSNWLATSFLKADGTVATTIVFAGAATETQSILVPAGVHSVRIRVSAFTSGTAAASMRAGMAGNLFRVVILGTPTVTANQGGAPWSFNQTQLAGTAIDVNSGTKSAGTQRVVIATDQPALTNKLLVTPDSVALPANQSVNVAQFGGNAAVTGTGTSGVGIPRVTTASDSSLTANQGTAAASTAGWPTIDGTVAAATAAWTSATALDSTVSAATTGYGMVLITINQTGTVSTGTGVIEGSPDGGTTWHPMFVASAAVAPVTSISLTAQASLERQISGWTNIRVRLNPVITGAGTANIRILVSAAATTSLNVASQGFPIAAASNAWLMKVTDGTTTAGVIAGTTALKTDLSSVAGTATSTAAAGVAKVGTVGNAGAAFDAANNAAMPANALAVGGQTQTIDTSPTAATATNLRYTALSTEGVTYVQEGGPKRFSCFVQAVTAMTQCQAAPAAGLRAYITSFAASNQAATVQTLDIVSGTGSNCATTATAISHKWQMGTNATTTSPQDIAVSFPTPLVPTAANVICVRPSAASAFGATITGYIAP